VIYGIGTDIIRIDRIEAAVARYGERFARRILGPQELEKYFARSDRASVRGLRFLATRFAAKEAFSKAIGLGMRTPMRWTAMQTLNAPSGRPTVVVSGALAEWMTARDLNAQVSLTDEVEYAVAFVIVEKTCNT
jgi:holo-[acyl-carrier protein] synthase